jgi:hypothetical protein
VAHKVDVAVSLVLLAVLYPFVLDLLNEPGLQITAGCLLAFGFGCWVGYRTPGASRRIYVLLAVAAGVLIIIFSTLYVLLLYPRAPLLMGPILRFGAGSLLTYFGGAILSDRLERKTLTLTSTAMSTGVAVAGLLISFFQLLK